MTTCDHGIRLDRFCGDCEDGFTFPDPIEETRRTLGRLGPVLILAAFVLAALYVVIGGAK